MTEIRVPKLNNNDAAYVLLEWLVEHGAAVGADEPVATIETSKAVEELASPSGGRVEHLLPAGSECRPGETIGRLRDGDDGAEESPAPEPVAVPGPAATGPVITGPARALIDELGIDLDRVRGLDVAVVKRADVERLAAATDSSADGSAVGGAVGGADGAAVGGGDDGVGLGGRELTANQRAVARTVTLSHRTIPAAYSVIKVDVGAAVALARDLTRRFRKLVGLPDLLVAALGRQHERHPGFFAMLAEDERTVVPAAAPHVGVTFDLGNGLYVPVIRDAARRTIEEIAGLMAEFRRRAAAGSLRERDLADGNIMLTLHHDADIVLAVPIVFPGQACAIALAAARPEPVLDDAGELALRTTANVGIAFDHRLVGGRQATLFLQDLKEMLESPHQLIAPQAPPGR